MSKKIFSLSLIIIFLVNNLAYGLSPTVTSSGMGEVTRGDTRSEMYAAGQKLFAVKKGPGTTIDFDSYRPTGFVGEAPKVEGVEFIKADYNNLPRAWQERNRLLQERDLIKALKYFREHEARIKRDDLCIEEGYFLVGEEKGELPIARLEDRGNGKWALVIHTKFVQMWNHIRQNDIWFKTKLAAEDPGYNWEYRLDSKGEDRIVSVAWGIFYRLAKHEMVDTTTDSLKRGELVRDIHKSMYTDRHGTAKGGGHIGYRYVDLFPTLFGWRKSRQPYNYDRLDVSGNEGQANDIHGRYARINDAIWMWFLGAYSFGDPTRYNNATLEKRLEWFFSAEMKKEGLNLHEEFPALSGNDESVKTARVAAIQTALAINYHFFNREGMDLPSPKTDPKLMAAYEAREDKVAESLYATGAETLSEGERFWGYRRIEKRYVDSLRILHAGYKASAKELEKHYASCPNFFELIEGVFNGLEENFGREREYRQEGGFHVPVDKENVFDKLRDIKSQCDISISTRGYNDKIYFEIGIQPDQSDDDILRKITRCMSGEDSEYKGYFKPLWDATGRDFWAHAIKLTRERNINGFKLRRLANNFRYISGAPIIGENQITGYFEWEMGDDRYCDVAQDELLSYESALPPPTHFFQKINRLCDVGDYEEPKDEDVITLFRTFIESYKNSPEPANRECAATINSLLKTVIAMPKIDLSGDKRKNNALRRLKMAYLIQGLTELMKYSDGMPRSLRTRFRFFAQCYAYSHGSKYLPGPYNTEKEIADASSNDITDELYRLAKLSQGLRARGLAETGAKMAASKPLAGVVTAISAYTVPTAAGQGPGAEEKALTQPELENIFKSVDLLHQSCIEIFMPQEIRLTSDMRKALDDINKKQEGDKKQEDGEIIIYRQFSNIDHLNKLLAAPAEKGAKRIVLTTENFGKELQSFFVSSPEKVGNFRDTRLLTINLSKVYEAMAEPNKTVHQAEIFTIAILARLLEEDKTPMVRAVLKGMLERLPYLGESINIDNFLDELGKIENKDTPIESIAVRLNYFLGAIVRFSEDISRQIKTMEELWRYA